MDVSDDQVDICNDLSEGIPLPRVNRLPCHKFLYFCHFFVVESMQLVQTASLFEIVALELLLLAVETPTLFSPLIYSL